MTFLACQRSSISPRWISCTAILPVTVASAGPASTSTTAGRRRHPAEQAVFDAAAQNVNRVILSSGQPLEIFESIAVFHCKALIDAAHDLPAGLRHQLAGLAAVAHNIAGKIARALKIGVVDVDKAAKRLARQCFLFQLVEGDILPFPLPLAAGFLNQPETHDIFQEADGTTIAAFVGEVCLNTFLIDDRAVVFGTEQAPGTAADIDKILFQLPVR